MRNLRSFLLCLSAALLACVLPATAAPSDEERATFVAARFLKDYFAPGGFLDYFRESQIVTPAAKAALRKIEAAAKKKSPETGLDFDPVVSGQDYAESYRLDNLVIDGDKATAEGVAEGFPPIKLRLVRTKSGWLIDGAGTVNPGPKAKS